MNESVNKLLLAGDKFISDMDFKKFGFTYSTCGPYRNLKKQEIPSVFIKMN